MNIITITLTADQCEDLGLYEKEATARMNKLALLGELFRGIGEAGTFTLSEVASEGLGDLLSELSEQMILASSGNAPLSDVVRAIAISR